MCQILIIGLFWIRLRRRGGEHYCRIQDFYNKARASGLARPVLKGGASGSRGPKLPKGRKRQREKSERNTRFGVGPTAGHEHGQRLRSAPEL